MIRKIGGWAFLIGIIIAIIAGIIGPIDKTVTIVLVVLGLIVGLLNITEKEVQSIFENEPATVFVAKAQEKFVGFIYFLTILDEIEIIDIGVHDHFRKKGLGKKLMQHAIHDAQTKNIKRILFL